jgi:type I restriction enzyme S subunit
MKFRKETEFRETEIGKIPRGWHVAKLGELIEMNHGERPEVILQEGDVPIYGGGGLYGFTNTYLVDKPYVLILARVGKGSVGKVYLARGRVWVTDNAIYGYSKDPNGITTVYAYYWLLFDKTWIEKYVRRSAGGYAIITLNSLNNLKLPLPPLNEQKGITKILSTIDKAVDLHYKGKERLECLKRGLMSELLTGRIRVREENGRLSFYRETELQETEIGKIPRNWRIEKLGSIVVKAKMGGTPKRSVREYWDGDIPFAKIEDITSSHKYLFKTSTTITRLGLENSNAWVVPRDSLLITIYGTLGAVAVNKIELATNQAIVGIVPKKEIVDVEFLYYWYSFFQPNWNKYVKKSTQPNLTLEIIVNSIIPLPPLNEQKGIVRILSLIDRTVELYHRERERLERLKRGLMDLLLTGKVRVIDGDVGS